MSPSATTAGRSIGRRLAERIGRHTYDMWFGHTTRFHVEGRRVQVAAESRFVADWIDGHFREALDGAAREALGEGAQVDLRVAPDLFEGTRDAAAHPGGRAPRRSRRPGRTVGLRRLDGMVVGTCNRLAHAAALRLAGGDGSGAGSPLFIHGECGLGKSHLLQGVVLGRGGHGAAAARYMTAEQFTNEYIQAVRSNGLEAFRRRTRRVELLAVDDVDFLVNKTATQREFQHMLDALHLAGARIVLAAPQHPMSLGVRPALASRFMAGMVAQVLRPDHATRVRLAHRLAAQRGLHLAEAAAETLAERCAGSVRELEGAVNKLAALHLVTSPGGSGEIGLLLAQQALAESGWRPRAPLHVDAVIDTVCSRLAVARADLLASGRHRRVVMARGLVAYLARSLTSLSYPEIAHALGRRHHSTVHTAATRVAQQVAQGCRLEVGQLGETIQVRELVDQLRHQVVQAASAGHGARAGAGQAARMLH